MFDGAPNVFAAEPNAAVTPTSLGLPGALPVVNRTAVEYAIKIGLALNCQIAESCRFARKQYFYPDLAKNFQTSQYDEPIAFDGWVDVELEDRSEEHTSELQSRGHLVCRLLLEKKKQKKYNIKQ